MKRARRVAPRGQALVLAALSLLLLGLMVALSFGLSHALRGKTRLQQHSDAMAYSMAIVEARSLNYFAVSNRAIAASYVAMNSLHAYMSAASVTSAMLDQGKTNFEWITAQEALQCLPCPKKFSACKHCLHAYQAYKISQKFNKKRKEYDKEIKNVDKAFDNAVNALDRMIDVIHASQHSVFAETTQLVRNGTDSQMGLIKKANAPQASDLSSAVGAINMGELACAIDGMPCTLPGKPGNSARTARAKVMTEVANASRPSWPANRSGVLKYLHPTFMKELMRDIQGDGASAVLDHSGSGKTVQSASVSAVEDGATSSNEGKVIGAEEHGQLSSYWKHGAWIGGYKASVFSGKSGNDHDPSSAHMSGRHDKFEGVYAKDNLLMCSIGGNCFMKFRADPDRNRDFGQPHVYSYVTMKMRTGDVKKAPWELNAKSEVKFTHGKNGTGQIKMAPDEGAAMSNALVYYHRLGDWQEQPNMFNPFWRAKLHPFTSNQAAQVLGAAGNTDAAQIAKSVTDLPL